MPITKRTLEKWRKEALKEYNKFRILPDGGQIASLVHKIELHQRIIRLTQECLDNNLLRKV